MKKYDFNKINGYSMRYIWSKKRLNKIYRYFLINKMANNNKTAILEGLRK
jgi:hypothetical protein